MPALLVVTLLVAGSTVVARDAPPPERHHFFVGDVFEGLPLTVSEPVAGNAFSYIYGACEAPPDGGCAPALEVQNWSICVRHPLEIDRLPRRILRIRGVPVIDYEDRLEVLTGRADVVLFGERRRVRRAVASLRARHGPTRLGRSLRAARLPRWVLRELKLVRVLRSRGVTRRALRTRLGISVSAIRMREQLATAVGKAALTVPPASDRPGDVIRDRHALITVREAGERMATPDQRRRGDRHRQRLKSC